VEDLVSAFVTKSGDRNVLRHAEEIEKYNSYSLDINKLSEMVKATNLPLSISSSTFEPTWRGIISEATFEPFEFRNRIWIMTKRLQHTISGKQQ